MLSTKSSNSGIVASTNTGSVFMLIDPNPYVHCGITGVGDGTFSSCATNLNAEDP